eukprot:TRINITY_DN25794_c0_g1_i1.p1 TRINITY_DN25794_c0_g1~~TRINITY_DN25794_c0_g1_i1.p1  ORF type:complete len:538 (+),score=204.85 TRINITY_DN25794_c0_g1_i1:175-1788(+)
MQFFKRVGDLLDNADDKATNSDLQTIAKEVTDAAEGAAKEAKRFDLGKSLDLGIVQGWNELTSQLSTDVKAAAELAAETVKRGSITDGSSPEGLDGAPDGPSAADAVTTDGQKPVESSSKPKNAEDESILQDLKEHVMELEAQEERRLQAQEQLRARLEQIEAEMETAASPCEAEEEEEEGEQDSEAEEEEEDDAADADEEGPPAPDPSPTSLAADESLELEYEERMAAMRKEFFERQDVMDKQIKALETELAETSVAKGPLNVELEFCRDQVNRLLRAHGLQEVPAHLSAKAKAHGAGRTVAGSAEDATDSDDSGDSGGDAEVAARQEQERLQGEVQAQQETYAALEGRLDEVMKSSEDATERVAEQRQLEKELEAAFAAASESVQQKTGTADAAGKSVQEAQSAKAEAERACIEEMQSLREARLEAHRSTEGPGAADALSGLRRKADALKTSCEELKEENSRLDARLRGYRAASAAELERAVPLATSGCWRSIDGPTMKFVSLLVRSACLRRTFAVYLLATYAWLFFLLFWLEHH